MKLDLKDRRILQELGDDARISITSLAKKVNLSREVTQYRLKRLISNGYIRWFTTLIDTTKLGYNTYQFYMQLEKITTQKENEIIDFLKNDKRVNYLAVISGNCDIMCECYAKNPQQFFQFTSEIRSRFSNNIRKIDSTVVIKEFMCLNKSLIDSWKNNAASFVEHESFCKSEVSLDLKEKKILYHLSNDCRMSYVDLANNIGASVDYVKYRVNQMIKSGIIISFKVIYNYVKLGLQQYAVMYRLKASWDRVIKFMNYLKAHPNVVYVIQLIGGWDVSVVMNVRDSDEFRRVLMEIRNNFTDVINEETPALMHDELKNNYLPPDCYFGE